MAEGASGRNGNLEIFLAPMGEGHLDQVCGIEKISFSTPWSRLSFVSELQNDLAWYLVALENETVAGYAGMWLILDEAHVTNLAVHPLYRGRGIGSALMGGLIWLAVCLGAVRMTLEVRVSNAAAIKLYEKLGFRREGRRRGYYTNPKEDALIMGMDLRRPFLPGFGPPPGGAGAP